MSTAADIDATALVDRFTLKALVESCLVLEEGVASMKDIDLGMMAGAGIIPPPFARADEIGLDEILAKLERAAQEWGEHFEPPTILRRLVAQGRLGVKTGQGFFPYARPDPGSRTARSSSRPATRSPSPGSTARPPTRSRPTSSTRCRRLWDAVAGSGTVRALIFASANPMLFCAGADIKSFTTMDAAAGRALSDQMHALLRTMERSSDRDDRRRQRAGVRRRLRAGDGVRLPDRRRVGDLRAARDQPRDHSRASAAPSGCRGWSERPRRSR